MDNEMVTQDCDSDYERDSSSKSSSPDTDMVNNFINKIVTL